MKKLRKLIDIPEVCLKDLKVAAASRNASFKKYLEDLIQCQHEKELMFHTNMKEGATGGKYKKELLKAFKDFKIQDVRFNFQIFCDKGFIYNLKTGFVNHQIVIINDNLEFTNEMSPKDMLINTPWYLSYSAWDSLRGENLKFYEFKVFDTPEWKEKFK